MLTPNGRSRERYAQEMFISNELHHPAVRCVVAVCGINNQIQIAFAIELYRLTDTESTPSTVDRAVMVQRKRVEAFFGWSINANQETPVVVVVVVLVRACVAVMYIGVEVKPGSWLPDHEGKWCRSGSKKATIDPIYVASRRWGVRRQTRGRFVFDTPGTQNGLALRCIARIS